jgi:transcriptional regulator with XRE-family HTH domain
LNYKFRAIWIQTKFFLIKTKNIFMDKDKLLKMLDDTGLSDLELGRQMGIDNSAITRWRKGGNVSKGSMAIVEKFLRQYFKYPDSLNENNEANYKIDRLRANICDSLNLMEKVKKDLLMALEDLEKIEKGQNNEYIGTFDNGE